MVSKNITSKSFLRRTCARPLLRHASPACVNRLLSQDTDLVPKRTGTGHDFSIQPPAAEEDDAGQIQLASPAGSVFVEIKATTTGGARMSVIQVGQAVMNKDHYFLCVVPGAEAVLDVEAFKAKAKSVTDIGDRFQHLHSQYLKMEIDLGLTPKTDAGLAIELSGHQVKFRVDEEVWSAGLDFVAALELLKSQVLPPRRPAQRGSACGRSAGDHLFVTGQLD